MNQKVAEVELTYKATTKDKCKVMGAQDAYKALLPTYKEGTINYREYFKVLLLNNANKVLGYTLISEGGLTCTAVDIRIIMQAALLANATAIILAHNHPSGNLTPSHEDKKLTESIRKAAALLQIRLVDHIIMTDESYYSFAESGLL